ncbi:hypothetical protein BH10PAT1_BH10PAT1_6630 [soil metagenome]
MNKYIVALSGFLALFAVIVLPQLQKPVICANSISCITNLNINIENNAKGTFMGQTITPPKIDLAADASKPKVLGDSTATGEKHIYVDLATQTLTAYQGNTLFMTALVSTGKWHPTPDGDFTIWTKIRSTRMTGGEGADYYNLPNVPFVMFFSNAEVAASQGFSIHGAYWHDNFGHTMSHGCVNMRTVDAEKLFNWTEDPSVIKTIVTISGQPPL